MRTQTEAKRFFAERVIERARLEGTPLSDVERRMLFWSESDSDPDLDIDPGLVEQLAAQISDEDYETKVTGFLTRSFQAESAADPRAGETWRQARSILNQGDHYLQLMVDRALDAQLRRWWQFWR